MTGRTPIEELNTVAHDALDHMVEAVRRAVDPADDAPRRLIASVLANKTVAQELLGVSDGQRVDGLLAGALAAAVQRLAFDWKNAS